MLKNVNNFVVIYLISGLALFWGMWFGLGSEVTTELSSSLALGASFTLLLTWFAAASRAVIQAVRGYRLDGYQLFHIGFWLLALALFGQRTWIISLRWMDRPAWLVLQPWGAFAAWSIAAACALILLSPETAKGEVPNRNKLYVVFAACLGCIIAGITIGIFIARG